MKKKLVSICVPIYNVEKYIEKCAKSLFDQTYENIEYIFVNDSTPDNSIVILRELMNLYPERKSSSVIIEHKYNRGLASARNTALKYASGEFIMWVDSDDYIDTNTVSTLIDEQYKTDSDIISYGVYREYKNKIVIQLPPKFENNTAMVKAIISRKVFVGVCGRLIRRSLYVDNRIMAHEGVNMAEDYSVMPFLAYYAQKVISIQRPMYHYNLCNEKSHVNNVSKAAVDQLWSAYQILYEFFFNKKDYYISLIYANIVLSKISLIVCAKQRLGQNYFEIIKSYGLYSSMSKLDIDYKDKIILSINNYNILLLYVNFALFMKRMFYLILSMTQKCVHLFNQK